MIKTPNIGPRDYKVSDIKRLFAISGNQCMKPGCIKKLIAEDDYTIVAKICHIEAASKGGARFRQSMKNDERRSYNNLILLCDEHHQMIDNKINEEKYTATILKKWKKEHITKNSGAEYTASDDLIGRFIQVTKEHYEKMDSLDGPYKPMISDDYVSREIEVDFLSVLKTNRCLLLTGISFCGKSEMAKNLANQFYQQGYIYKRVSNVRDAASFLESVGANRICFLEDPFGHSLGEELASELKRLQDLLNNVQENHLLIVTSRKEIIQSVFNSSQLSECAIYNNKWYDITSTNVSFLEKIWLQISSKNFIKEENIANVQSLLSTNKLLQPGQLVYLANLPELKNEILTKDKLYQLAQIDAKKLQQSIINLDSFTWKVFFVFGICCDTIYGCSYEDLEYILDSSKKKLSLEPENELMRTFPGKEIEDFIYPTYTEDNNEISDYEYGIDLLEKRGYISLEYDKYVFTHPQYREIAKGLIDGLTTVKQRQVLPFIQNSLTCLNSNIAYNTSKNVSFIIEKLNNNFKQELIDTIFEVSEYSYYPKVIDQCYLYLLQNFRSKEVEKHQRDLLYKLKSSTDNSNIIFFKSEPIKWRETSSLSQLFISAELPYTKIEENIKNGVPVSSQNIWATLLSVNRIKENFSIQFLEYAFKSNEVFIRNLTAYNFFVRVNEFHDSLLKDKILLDEQPSVLFYALKGFLQGIPNNGKDLNRELTERFLYFFNSDEIFCIRSSNLMTNFSTDYASDSIDWKVINHYRQFWVWRIWADLFVGFMATFPKNVRFSNTPRFSGMMNKAKEYIYPEQAVKIAKGLMGYLEENLKTRVPDNFEMHLIDFLIDATRTKPQIRFNVYKKLIAGNYTTTFIGYNLSWAVNRWDILELKEKKAIIDLMTSSRIDVEWLKAILINSCTATPAELQKIIFGKSDFLSQSIEDIVSNTPKPLLEKLITVYSGKDGAIDEIGLTYRSKLLKDITIHISINNIKIEYRKCLLLFLTDILNGIREDERADVEANWFQTVLNSNSPDEILELVIYQVTRTSFVAKDTKYVFKTLIDRYFKDNRIDFLATQIAHNIEKLTYTSGDLDVLFVLNYRGFLNDHVFPIIPRNYLLINLLSGIKNRKVTKEDFHKCIKPIMDEDQEPIHFHWIFSLLKQVEEKKLLDDDILEELKTIPNDIHKRHKEYFENEVPFKKLENFIYFLT